MNYTYICVTKKLKNTRAIYSTMAQKRMALALGLILLSLSVIAVWLPSSSSDAVPLSSSAMIGAIAVGLIMFGARHH